MPFPEASISSFQYPICGMKTFHLLDLMHAMCLIPLNSSKILYIFSCLLALLLLLTHCLIFFSEICLVRFVRFVGVPLFFDQSFLFFVCVSFSCLRVAFVTLGILLFCPFVLWSICFSLFFFCSNS